MLERTVRTDTRERLSIEAEYLCEENIGKEVKEEFSEKKISQNKE